MTPAETKIARENAELRNLQGRISLVRDNFEELQELLAREATMNPSLVREALNTKYVTGMTFADYYKFTTPEPARTNFLKLLSQYGAKL